MKDKQTKQTKPTKDNSPTLKLIAVRNNRSFEGKIYNKGEGVELSLDNAKPYLETNKNSPKTFVKPYVVKEAWRSVWRVDEVK
jgi:hypothetical protein